VRWHLVQDRVVDPPRHVVVKFLSVVDVLQALLVQCSPPRFGVFVCDLLERFQRCLPCGPGADDRADDRSDAANPSGDQIVGRGSFRCQLQIRGIHRAIDLRKYSATTARIGPTQHVDRVRDALAPTRCHECKGYAVVSSACPVEVVPSCRKLGLLHMSILAKQVSAVTGGNCCTSPRAAAVARHSKSAD
jgi:hypothetical protein